MTAEVGAEDHRRQQRHVGELVAQHSPKGPAEKQGDCRTPGTNGVGEQWLPPVSVHSVLHRGAAGATHRAAGGKQVLPEPRPIVHERQPVRGAGGGGAVYFQVRPARVVTATRR